VSVVVLIGRILFCFLFLTSGYGHLAQRKAMAQYASAKGVPAPMPAVLAGGVLLVAGGIMVLLGLWADLGSLLLALFLLPTAVLMHGFWKESDQQSRTMEMVQFSKDTALGGAALMLFAFFSFSGSHLGLTITGPLFHLS
jgi:putative oxidoreductase